jgi:hypothetical protein
MGKKANVLGEYERVPNGNGLLHHIPTGKFLHESQILGVPRQPIARLDD